MGGEWGGNGGGMRGGGLKRWAGKWGGGESLRTFVGGTAPFRDSRGSWKTRSGMDRRLGPRSFRG